MLPNEQPALRLTYTQPAGRSSLLGTIGVTYHQRDVHFLTDSPECISSIPVHTGTTPSPRRLSSTGRYRRPRQDVCGLTSGQTQDRLTASEVMCACVR